MSAKKAKEPTTAELIEQLTTLRQSNDNLAAYLKEEQKAKLAKLRERNKGTKRVGLFRVRSGRLVVTDPCYSRDTWCQGVLDNVRDGVWEAYVAYSDEKDWGVRVAVLTAYYDTTPPEEPKWERQQFEVGVDSGQAGIFDFDKYPEDPSDTPFYDECCDLTLSDASVGVLDFGVVSSSGFGDGGYRCETAQDADGHIIAVRITFIGDDDDIDEDGIEVDYSDDYEDIEDEEE